MALYDVSTSEKKASPELVAGGTLYSSMPLASLVFFSGDTDKIPTGFCIADGRALSRTTYASLFAILGTTWGSGDGSTTFNIPDLSGKTAMGVETGHALGASEDGALPNITGTFGGWRPDTASPVATGAFQLASSRSSVGAATTGDAITSRSFDASRSSSIYTDGQTKVDPANVRAYWIIKISEVGVPADFLANVEAYLDTENILWENQSPDSAFSAQDVTLANDNYKYLTIYYKEYYGRSMYLSVKFPKGVGCYLNKIDCTGSSYYVYNRSCEYRNSTKLHFNDTYQSAQTTANNAHCIPIKIVGSMT